jgi:hypothetical protein
VPLEHNTHLVSGKLEEEAMPELGTEAPTRELEE